MKIIKKLKKLFKRNKISVEQMVFGYGKKKEPQPYNHSNAFKYKKVADLTGGTSHTLRIITVNLSEYAVSWLNDMVNKKFFSSRSQAIREAVNFFMRNSIDFTEYLENKYGKDIILDDRKIKVIEKA